MKIKKIAALCKKTKRFYLWNQKDQKGEVTCQWLGNGLAMYPLEKIPPLDESSLRAMLDISEDKGKFAFQLMDVPPGLNIADNDLTEREVKDISPPYPLPRRRFSLSVFRQEAFVR